MFTFNDETHEYMLNGERIESVTQVLVGEGMIETRWFTEEGRIRGTYVHDTVLLYLQGKLNTDDLHDDLWGYLEAWVKFETEHKFKVREPEKPLYHPVHMYAGKPDVPGWMGDVQIPTVIDIKTGAEAPATGIQLGAYKMLLQANGFPVAYGQALYLSKDGTYKLGPKSVLIEEANIFLAALSIRRWKLRNLK